ncbi:MAG: enoyl-CoA hydratase/isomerase family protein [Betaproteobacteria bacterium]
MQAIQYSCDAGVATIVLNRPEVRNAISPAMMDELDQTLFEIGRDDTVRAVILTGAGAAFCAGGDVLRMNDAADESAEQRRARMRRAHRTVKALHALDRPVIAAVDGAAFGAGFGIALLCDIVLASNRARFCMVFGRVGLVPDYGSLYTLPRVVGLQRAKEIMFSAREIDPIEAQQLGIVLEVMEPEALLPLARTLAQALAQASPTALALTKDALNASLANSLESVLELEAAAQGVTGTSAYSRECFRRFAAKERSPFQWPAKPAA